MFYTEIPRHERQHTWLAALYGAILLVWFSAESTSILLVSILGTGLAILLALLGLMRWIPGRKIAPGSMIILGALTGFLAIGCVIFLMIFRNAWHAHATLDFPGEVIAGMIDRAFAWTSAGGLLGGAMAFWSAVLKDESGESLPEDDGDDVAA